MTPTPFFSVIIPAYNTSEYLPRCVESLITQSFQNFEILLVNDGSTDGTGSVLDMLQAKDRRIQGFHIPHRGASTARNCGLLAASGKYVLFVDSDDALVPHALERIHKNLENTPDMLSFKLVSLKLTDTFGQRKDCEDTPRRKTIFETADDCIRRNTGFISACTHAYRLQLIRENTISFREGLVFGEDRLFNSDYLRCCKETIYINDELYLYSFRENSSSHRFIPGMLKILMMIQSENVMTMLTLCSRSVTEHEKQKFCANCFFSTVREAWEHLILYYSALSQQQRTCELDCFLDIHFPNPFCSKTLRLKQRIWLAWVRCASKLRMRWLLRLLLYVDTFFLWWKKK